MVCGCGCGVGVLHNVLVQLFDKPLVVPKKALYKTTFGLDIGMLLSISCSYPLFCTRVPWPARINSPSS